MPSESAEKPKPVQELSRTKRRVTGGGGVWRDLLAVVLLASLAGFASWKGAQHIGPMIIQANAENAWFEADTGRVLGNMTSRVSNHARASVHPVFSLIAYPPVEILMATGVEPLTAVIILTASVAGFWISVLFILFRLMGCPRFDAGLFSVLAAASASAIFWFTVPETYFFGSLTILVALLTVALADHRKIPEMGYVMMSALTLTMTTTNWMAGIAATFASFSWQRTLQITINAFFVVLLLSIVQNRFFSGAPFFFSISALQRESGFVSREEQGGPVKALSSFVFHTMVMPAVEEVDRGQRLDLAVVRTQASLPGSGGVWGMVAVGLWAALLALGLWALFSLRTHRRLRITLGLTVLGQLALHLLYGEETFLYSLHYAPLLVVLAALATLTPARRLALVLAAGLLISAGVNNVLQFDRAVGILKRQLTPYHSFQTDKLPPR